MISEPSSPSRRKTEENVDKQAISVSKGDDRWPELAYSVYEREFKDEGRAEGTARRAVSPSRRRGVCVAIARNASA